LPKKILAQFLCRRANVGLMVLSNVAAFYYGTSPNKFFDYLASGLLVLINYLGWMADMVSAEGIGLIVRPDDPVAFAEALICIADARAETAQIGPRARDLAHREFLRDKLAQRCISVMESAI